MPKRIIKRYMPHPDKIKEHKHLSLFGDLIHDPNVWHLNRYSVAKAVSVGLFFAYIPLPMQMILAAATALIIHANLPISVILVWISNPLTMPPMYFFALKLGNTILGTHAREAVHFTFSLEWLTNELTIIWKPFLLGCIICGSVLAIVGNIAFRLFWRWWVVHHWRQRQAHRAKRQS